MAIRTLNMTGYEKSAANRISGFRNKQASGRMKLAAWLFKPALAPILRDRRILILLAGLASIQTGLTAAGWQAWQCPLSFFSGLSCPGCGLSRASVLLAQGQWNAAIHMHAFAPVALAAVIFIAIAALLPRRHLQRMSVGVEAVEQHTGIAVFMGLALLTYWGLRVAGVTGYIPGFE